MLMGKTSKGRSTSHQLFKDKARNRVDDLQGMFKDLQYAMKESHTGDIALLQERMNQTLSEWKAELNEPSPASSQNEGSLGSFSSDLFRFLVEDDATSALIHPTNQNPYPETNPQINEVGDSWDLEVQDYFVNQAAPSAPDFHGIDQYRGPFLGQHTMVNNLDMSPQLNSHQYNVGHDINPHIFLDTDGSPQCGESVKDLASSLICSIDPPSAYLGEKCALWDCARPAKGLEGCQDYCDRFHADLAKTEGPPGSTPVMRRGGIDLKDGLLFAALIARTKGKDVGIPECEGAATSKSPWNTPELFDLVLEGETIREWLFFDNPRRAFESGSRKQRSLPDYSGRGWHESRKQMVKEFNGLKRSYYMDPQPLHNFELHLYVYENDNNDVCALHRLELKIFDGKKSPKGKASSAALADIQKQNTRSTAEFQVDDSQSLKFGEKIRLNGVEYILGAPNQNTPSESSFSGDYSAIQTQQDGQNSFTGYVGSGQYEEDNKHFASGLQPSTCHPSSAFIKLKCALWDCSRPAQGVDYCSILHSTLALSEGTLSNTPVLRPGGISLRDGVLFASLSSKIQGKDVGIPECEGAATMKSPWNAPEHFDIFLFEGETIREWLFFDKPRKAFESGNRKQRSLPDYNGRGWHASRKQVMKEYGGVKKSYYMDPQPMDHAEWHLYEYEIDYTDALTLFRLELKSVDGKKSSKGKAASKDSSIADLQKQMGRLTADSEQSVKHEATRDNSNSPETVNSARKQMSPNVDNYCYGESTGGTGSFS